MKTLAMLSLLVAVTCTTIGQNTFCSDGKGGRWSCTTIGQMVVCR